MHVKLLFSTGILFSLYQKYKKHFLILRYRIFSFDYFASILTHVERLHFIEIVEIALEKLHLEAYHLFEIQD
jgi:hypothetical protein